MAPPGHDAFCGRVIENTFALPPLVTTWPGFGEPASVKNCIASLSTPPAAAALRACPTVTIAIERITDSPAIAPKGSLKIRRRKLGI